MIRDPGRDDVGRLLGAWMDGEARLAPPDGLMDRVVARSRTARRRPRWLLLEWWVPDDHLARAAGYWRPVPVLLLVAALVIIAALLVIVAGAPRQRVPAPFGPAANGRLVVDTNGSLLTVDLSGGGARPLVDRVPLAAGATFSRDGTRLVFWGDGSPDTLYLANADGTAVRRLVGNLWIATDKSPTWSPDGRHVAISTESGPNKADEELLVIDVDSGAASIVSGPELGGLRAILPAWSPDGAWIAFVALPRGDASARPAYWIVHPDGTGARILPTRPIAIDALVIAAHWAPDPAHLRVAYTAVDPSGSPAADVFDVSTDRETQMSSGGRSVYPAWSPDGRSLAWLGGALGTVEIVASEGPSATRLIPRTGIDGPPAWSPDGRQIYGLDGPKRTLIVVAVDGSGPAVRIPHDASQALADWQRVTP